MKLSAHASLTLQLLEWIAQRPRTYTELMGAWKTSCPRLAIWEDACTSGLVDCEPGAHGVVSVTAKGRQCLEAGVVAE
jgi:hypothetical protein